MTSPKSRQELAQLVKKVELSHLEAELTTTKIARLQALSMHSIASTLERIEPVAMTVLTELARKLRGEQK